MEGMMMRREGLSMNMMIMEEDMVVQKMEDIPLILW